MMIALSRMENQDCITDDGDIVGYAALCEGADAALLLERDQIADSTLGAIARALDDRDGVPCPSRNLCMLGRNVQAKEFTTYAD